LKIKIRLKISGKLPDIKFVANSFGDSGFACLMRLDKQTDRQTDRQTGRQTDRERERQTDRQTERRISRLIGAMQRRKMSENLTI
jgi:hypothetical protein